MANQPSSVSAAMGTRRVKDFSMLLSDLGEPDQDFKGYMDPQPEFLKWIVQEPAGGVVFSCFFRTDLAEVHFTGKLLDGTVFASSREIGTPLLLPCFGDDVMYGFSRAIVSMQPGEKSIFRVPPPLALAKNGCPASIPWNIPPDQTLRFDIELISFIRDILHDQGVLKKIIKLGEETWWPPTGLDEVFVKVNYNARLKDGTSVSKSEEVEFSVREGFFCPAFAHAVKTMTKGEEAILIVQPEYGFGEQGRPSIGNDAAVPPDATLYVYFQLISWTEVSHVGENQDIIKRTTPTHHRPDYCKKPHNQSVVKVRWIGKLQDGTVFDRRGHDGEEPFEFTIDEEHVIYGLDEAVMTMGEGEVASFTIPPQHAFGAAGSNQYQLALVPPNSVVIYEIELLSVVDFEEHPWPQTEGQAWCSGESCLTESPSRRFEAASLQILRGKDLPLFFPSPDPTHVGASGTRSALYPWPQTKTTEESIEAAKIKERDGDDLFNSRKYLRAYRRYLRARQILPYLDETKEMFISLTLKSAECAIQLQRYEQALDCYHEVLRLDPRNAKALQMVAQPLPKSSVAIHAPSMNRGLKKCRRLDTGVNPESAMWGAVCPMSLVHGHKLRASIVIPPLATPEANSNHASQPPVSPAPTAVHKSLPAPAPPAVSVSFGGGSTTTTTTNENRSSGTTRKRKAGLASLFRR